MEAFPFVISNIVFYRPVVLTSNGQKKQFLISRCGTDNKKFKKSQSIPTVLFSNIWYVVIHCMKSGETEN